MARKSKPAIEKAALAELRAALGARVLAPDDAGYDEVRRIHNGMFERRPAAIARCLGAADVADAIRFARAHDLELAVRGGGHSVAGNSVCDGGVMLDLSLMKGVHVDPARRSVRAQGGVTWGEFNRETQLHGLATTGGVVSTTGIAGLTLGGGLGWLMGKHGIAADNLISAELVNAEGELVYASADEDGELLWALRGGGGNFGVASWLEYRLHPVGPVTSGLVAHPIERARELLQFFREFTATSPDELTLNAALTHAPDGSGVPIAAMVGCHCGALAEGAVAMLPIKRFGSALIDTLGPASYCDTNTIFDASFPRGARNYWKSSFLEQLSDAAIEALIRQFASCPSAMSGLFLEHYHGAAARLGAGDTAFPHRRTGYNLLVISQWRAAEDDEQNIAWARASYDALRPYMVRESYANYQTDDATDGAAQSLYGPNIERLVALKNKLDPTNFFHLNQNIQPTR